MPVERGREVPPGMAGAKRGPEEDGEFSDEDEEMGGQSPEHTEQEDNPSFWNESGGDREMVVQESEDEQSRVYAPSSAGSD